MCLHNLSYCLGCFFPPLPLGKPLPFKNTLLFLSHLVLNSLPMPAKLFVPCSSPSHPANDTRIITFVTLYFTYMLGQMVNSLGKGFSLNVIHIWIFQVWVHLIKLHKWMNEPYWSFPHTIVLCNQTKWYFYCKCFYYNMTYAFLKNSIFCKTQAKQT